MGSCLGVNRDLSVHGSDDDLRSHRSAHRGGHYGTRGFNGRSLSTLSDSTSSNTMANVTKNRPLRAERIRWKSDIPLTLGQLKSKRDEFWDTAPAFEGKQEIWAALKAAVELATAPSPEVQNGKITEENLQLAQAILDGAGISLPHGSLVECYDELGTRYAIPVYCLSYPINLVTDETMKDDEDDSSCEESEEEEENDEESDSPAEHSEPVVKVKKHHKKGIDFKIKVRISLTGDDVRMEVNSAERVICAKKRLQSQVDHMVDPHRQRWYFGGRLLTDRSRIGSANITPGFVVQCIVPSQDVNVIRTDTGQQE